MDKIPVGCREFGTDCSEERREFAGKIIAEFAKGVAPPRLFDHSNRSWTQSVRRRLIEICPDDCLPVPIDPLSPKGEFLVDCVWEEREDGKRILLACESEWAEDRYGKTHWHQVEEDFEKLLAIKSPFKVLIFSSSSESGAISSNIDFSVEYAKGRLTASLQNYGHHLAGEVYIFIDFPRTRQLTGSGIYQSFLWAAPGGRSNKIEFKDSGRGSLNRPADP
jgi:hypothetical protein